MAVKMSPLLGAVALGVLFAGVATPSASSSDEVVVGGNVAEVYSFNPPLLRQSLIPCTCSGLTCSCCTQVNLPFVGNNEACLNTLFDVCNLAVATSFKLNNNTIFITTLTATNLPPICYPVPQLPILSVCLRIHNVKLLDRAIHACIRVELVLLDTALVALNFDCVKVNPTGIIITKPQECPQIHRVAYRYLTWKYIYNDDPFNYFNTEQLIIY